MLTKTKGSVLLATLIILTVLVTIGLFFLSTALSQRKIQNRALKFNQKDAVLEAILGRATADLKKLHCENSPPSLDPVLTGSGTVFKSSSPRVYGKAGFQLRLSNPDGSPSSTFLSPETDPQVWIEPGQTAGTSKIYKINIQAQVCVDPVHGRTAPPPTTPDVGKGTPWRPACPEGKKENVSYVGFLDTSKISCSSPPPPPPPPPPPDFEGCVTVEVAGRAQWGRGVCPSGKRLLGGGCKGGMDGCLPEYPANAWSSSGPASGVNTTYAVAQCCTKTGGINTFAGRQIYGTVMSCGANEVMIGIGAYGNAGAPISCYPTSPNTGRCDGGWSPGGRAVCYPKPANLNFTVIQGTSMVTCPAGSKLVSGGWNFGSYPFTGRLGPGPSSSFVAYPSGNSFIVTGGFTAYALCALSQ